MYIKSSTTGILVAACSLCLVNDVATTTLGKTTPIGNPSSSNVVGRLEQYLCMHTVKLFATMLTDCYSTYLIHAIV